MKNLQIRDHRPLYVFVLLIILGATAALTWAQTRPAPPAPKMIPILSDYRKWKLVNQTPAPMDPAVAAMCAYVPPSPRSKPNLSETAVMGSGGPHEKKWINVFVNSIGESAMLTDKKPRFPVGTVIVKQKLALPAGAGKSNKAERKPAPNQAPELLTVMIKREADYDEKNGNWEYMVTDGPGLKISAQGQLPKCQSCHRPHASTDYVVRSYLPASVEKALRDAEPAR